MSFQLPAIRKLCQDACQRLMLHPVQEAKSNMVSVVRIQVFVLFTLKEGVANWGDLERAPH